MHLALIVLVLGGLFLVCSTAVILMKRHRQVRTIRAIERHPVWRWYQDTQRDQE